MIFEYGDKEISYLKGKDRILGEIIDQVGHVERKVDPDLFSAVVHHIVGQQISTKAQETVWGRVRNKFGTVTAEHILAGDVSELQNLGISFRKAGYIRDFARKVKNKEFDLDAVRKMPDSEAIEKLVTLEGIGVWTAEMILLFCLQRPDIFSYEDLGIRKGLCTIYHHRQMNRELFEKYRRRFSPYGSVASLYIWEFNGRQKKKRDP